LPGRTLSRGLGRGTLALGLLSLLPLFRGLAFGLRGLGFLFSLKRLGRAFFLFPFLRRLCFRLFMFSADAGFLSSFLCRLALALRLAQEVQPFLGLQRKWRVRVLLDETFEFRGIRRILDPVPI